MSLLTPKSFTRIVYINNCTSAAFVMPLFASSLTRPFRRQLADHLRRQFENGRLQPGARLQPELEMAEEHALARGTVRQARLLLVNQGLLQNTRRKGTFVVDLTQLPHAPLIGMSVPYLRDNLTSAIVHGAESTLRLNGFSLIFVVLPSVLSLCSSTSRI